MNAKGFIAATVVLSIGMGSVALAQRSRGAGTQAEQLITKLEGDEAAMKLAGEPVSNAKDALKRAGNARTAGDTQGADRASVKLNLPMKDLISNDDVTASVEYDVPSQVATVNLGYTSGDVNVGLKSNVNLDSQSATHKATVNYSGIEGVGVSVEVDQDVAGKLSVTKDKYELRVPFSKDGGVNPDDVQLHMKWSQDL